MPATPARPDRPRRRSAADRLLMLVLGAVVSIAVARRSPPRASIRRPTPVPMVTLDALPLGVPLARLDEDARGRVEAVLGTSLFAHRVTGLRARSREPVFRFLLDHPHFAAAVARALRLGGIR